VKQIEAAPRENREERISLDDGRLYRESLIRAIEADDALTDELIAMVRHTGCPDDENLREARYDLATEFIHSDAVYAALKLAPRARHARLNTFWREWQNKFQTPEGRAEEKAVLEEMKKADDQIAGGGHEGSD
jgi:hypothetical protein